MSPEERLLNLIRGKNKKPDVASPDASPDGPSGKTDGGKRAVRPAFGALFKGGPAAIEFFRRNFTRQKLLEPEFLKVVNRYLAVVLAVLSVYFVIELIFVRPYEDMGSTAGEETASARPRSHAPKDLLPAAKDYSRYSGVISGRQIFGPAQGESGQAQAVITSDDISSALGLVGIITGPDPQAIIEDKKDQKTYYLKRGESFNNVTVEEISEGKVVVNYDGRRVTLFL